MSRPKRGTRGSRTERPSWDADPAGRTDAGFTCVHCARLVPQAALGTSQRNHCPFCLWSAHVDIRPGDRNCLCRSAMEPVALWAAEGGELRVLHRCTGCGVIKPNRLAGDDAEDVIDELVARLVRARGGRER